MQDAVIAPGETKMLRSGLSVVMDKGFFMRIESRSGLHRDHCITAFPGIIDPDYTGEIIIGLKNGGDSWYTVAVGDRIAQLIIYPRYTCFETDDPIQVVRYYGFGSTGV